MLPFCIIVLNNGVIRLLVFLVKLAQFEDLKYICVEIQFRIMCNVFLFMFAILSRYGPPTRTDNRIIVENLSSRVSWQVRRIFCQF